MTDNMNWLPINTAPKEFKPFNMFVAIALEVLVVPNGAPYTSDPWCVWRDRDGSFARWPHSFAPTHWCPLPDYDPRRPKPPSLAEEALDQLSSIQIDLTRCGMGISVETIRAALERLQELEGQSDD